MVINMKYFLYRLDPEGEAEIFGRFNNLSEAKLSAKLLMIEDSCFILSGDIRKMYFYEDNHNWEYEIITNKGQQDFLECYPDPHEYESELE